MSGGAHPAPDVSTLTVRRSDVDETGRARAGVFFEYVQEARIRYLMDLHSRGDRWSGYVVARTDVDYRGPVTRRPEPYEVLTWVAHVGTRSFTVGSEVRDGDQVLATAAVVMVTFDPETQRTAEMAEGERARLEQALAVTS
jgi:acyl-CoA thioester hydrolase